LTIGTVNLFFVNYLEHLRSGTFVSVKMKFCTDLLEATWPAGCIKMLSIYRSWLLPVTCKWIIMLCTMLGRRCQVEDDIKFGSQDQIS